MQFSDINTLDDLNKVYPKHILDKFPIAGQGVYVNETNENWNSWIWQQKKRINSLEGLEKVINLSEAEKNNFVECDKLFHTGITPYYANLMDKNDTHCPIRMQAIPQKGELIVMKEDLEDPLGEEADMPVPGLTHRYPDRVLFYTSHNCPVYCRHCTRKRKVADPSTSSAQDQLDAGIEYIRAHKEVRDVVVSGGDPLSLSNKKLEYIIKNLRGMEHIELIRLGTRNPVTLPQRIDNELLEILQRYQPIYLNTHFNHPREMTRESLLACTRLSLSGVVLGNQSVLLKGVNDNPKTMLELSHKLLLMRIRPYYIYQCDLSQGISHFRTSVEKGVEIIENMRGWTSGLAIPQFVIDAPGGGGKIPINPNYVVKKDGNKITLRNYKKQQYDYFEPV